MKNLQSKIIAHRGASFDAPENTLPAIQLAWYQKICKVEIDIHMTKDFEIVVIHDASTQKTSNINLKVSEHTLTDLQKLDVGIWKGEKWKNTIIPSLKEVLATLPNYGTLIIEIKCGIEIVPYLKNAIQNIPVQQIEFICFDFDVISQIKKTLPKHKALWLLDLDYTEATKTEILPLETYIKKAKTAKLNGLNLWAGKIATKQYIRTIQQENLLVYIWSTNSIKKTQYFLKANVDGITTDKPNWILNKLQEINE